MKRYLLFVGEEYYPRGGWKDFRGSFDSIEEAQKAVFTPRDNPNGHWFHIIDSEHPLVEV